MLIVQRCSAPRATITLRVPAGTISGQIIPKVYSSLFRLRGCFGEQPQMGCDVCVAFDGEQTTEATIARIAERIFNREQSGYVQFTVATCWDATVVFVVDVTDKQERRETSARLRSNLPEAEIVWHTSREIHIRFTGEPPADFTRRVTQYCTR